MILLRPGVKVKLWTGGYTNQPSVDAPWLLKFVSVLAILSTVGTLVYAVALTLSPDGVAEVAAEEAIYVAVLHFILPMVVAYTVITNSALSRVLILGYSLTLYLSTVGGKGILGELNIDPTLKIVLATVVLAVIGLWLFLSPKMRLYYALIAGKPVPADLQSRAAAMISASRLSPKRRAAFEWLADHLETIVLFGFIALSIYAYVSTGA